uniref:Platelet-derived growth factor D n=1 Tax=Anas platyrhynchos platyrhynchos TaxID=8840 RepID=A0A493SZM2_ANAPP
MKCFGHLRWWCLAWEESPCISLPGPRAVSLRVLAGCAPELPAAAGVLRATLAQPEEGNGGRPGGGRPPLTIPPLTPSPRAGSAGRARARLPPASLPSQPPGRLPHTPGPPPTPAAAAAGPGRAEPSGAEPSRGAARLRPQGSAAAAAPACGPGGGGGSPPRDLYLTLLPRDGPRKAAEKKQPATATTKKCRGWGTDKLREASARFLCRAAVPCPADPNATAHPPPPLRRRLCELLQPSGHHRPCPERIYKSLAVLQHQARWYDFVEVEDLSETSTVIRGRWCGHKEVPPRITSRTNQIKITFKSDDYFVAKPGFKICYSLVGVSYPSPSVTDPTLTAEALDQTIAAFDTVEDLLKHFNPDSWQEDLENLYTDSGHHYRGRSYHDRKSKVDLDRLNDDVKRYSCTPRNYSVNLREELKLTNVVFFPRCLLVQRCGGNCGCGTSNWKSCTCVSGKTVKKYHEVLKFVPEAGHPRRKGRTRNNMALVDIQLDHHERCDCVCSSRPPR